MQLDEAICGGVMSRIHPVVMTALLAAIALLPAATSKGIGSETTSPLAIVMFGGLISATVLSLFIFQIVFKGIYRIKVKNVPHEAINNEL